MSTAKTYVVGESGIVKRLDNLTGSWTDVSVFNSYPITSGFRMNDVMTDPLDQSKVFVVGQGLAGSGAFGIYVSTDAGVSWLIPSGNYQTNFQDPAVPMEWHEVWVVNSNTIIACGNYGYCAISNDGGASFTLTNQMPNVVEIIAFPPDVPFAYSTHWLNPQTGIVGTRSNVLKTVNGGANWSVLNGGSPLGGVSLAAFIRGIYISSDELIIVALAKNNIYRSTNGGNTFSIVHNFPFDAVVGEYVGEHLTWKQDNSGDLWAFGKHGYRVKSTDQGATWTVISAYSSQATDHYAGHFYLNQDGFYSYGDEVYQTSDGSVSGVLSDSWPAGVYPRAIWTNYLPSTCYWLRSCDGSVGSIYVTNDLSSVVGQVVRLCPENIPSGRQASIPNQSLPQGGTSININPNDPGTSKFFLSPCCGGIGGYFQVTNDLSAYVGLTVVIPSIDPDKCFNVSAFGNSVAVSLGLVNLTGGVYFTNCVSCENIHPCTSPSPTLTDCACFIVEEAYECVNPITLAQIPPAFDNCDDCIPEYCYFLVDCTDPTNYIITDNQDMYLYLGKTVKLDSTGDVCWNVLLAPDCENATQISAVSSEYISCADCLPPQETEPLSLKVRSVKPGYDTPGCSPEYTEKVNCNFAEQYYQKMVSDKYGLQICCSSDIEKWTIKKELLDLKVLYDPNFCSTTNTCCPPECVIAELLHFAPIGCAAPSGVSTVLDYPTFCIPPENVITILDIFNPPVCECYKIDLAEEIDPDTGSPIAVSATVQYRVCEAEGLNTKILVGGETFYTCSDLPPVVVSGTPTITLIPNANCAAGLCP